MIERKAKIAIAAALFWMAFATVVILGTHGEAVAKAGSAPAGKVEAVWMAQPVGELPQSGALAAPRSC